MKKLMLFLCLWPLLVACDSTDIEQDKVKEVLSQYANENPETKLLIETNLGKMTVVLYKDVPLHRANFIRLLKKGYYEDSEFYRIIYGFMIQGGNFFRKNKLSYRLPSEANPGKYFHKKGALAMAIPEVNNPNAESSPTEFYIVQGSRYTPDELQAEAASLKLQLSPEQIRAYTSIGGSLNLDSRYTVFGEVVEGLDVIDKIAAVETHGEDRPVKKVPLKITILE